MANLVNKVTYVAIVVDDSCLDEDLQQRYKYFVVLVVESPIQPISLLQIRAQ